jgi:hypothetical protein
MDKSESQIRRIVVERMDRCSVCHRAFDEDDVEVLSRKQDMWMMIVQCRDCQARSFVAALVGDATSTSPPGQLFDLAAAEFGFEERYELEEVESIDHSDDPALSIDDVIEMHEFLDDFDGDFKRLFDSMPKG